MTRPRRIQLSRAAGWRLPAGAVKVDRTTKFGNPHVLPPAQNATVAQRRKVVDAFRRDLVAGALAFSVDDVRRELGGKTLACWCRLEHPCHADCLLAMANGGADVGDA